MNTDRRTILALIAMGRITPAEAERLLAAWNESRETAWILAASVGFALLAQLHLHDLVPMLNHLISTQVQAFTHLTGQIMGEMGGLL